MQREAEEEWPGPAACEEEEEADGGVRQRFQAPPPPPLPQQQAPEQQRREARRRRRLLRAFCVSAVVFVGTFGLIAYVITGDATFGLVRWPGSAPPVKPAARTDRTFTSDELSKYDGRNPYLPIFLAIKGRVFDVSAGRRFYGPEGSYHGLAGRDASRAFHNGCFHSPNMHDLRGLSAEALESVDQWLHFFEVHESYFQVGVLTPPPLPATPPPDHCEDPEDTREPHEPPL